MLLEGFACFFVGLCSGVPLVWFCYCSLFVALPWLPADEWSIKCIIFILALGLFGFWVLLEVPCLKSLYFWVPIQFM